MIGRDYGVEGDEIIGIPVFQTRHEAYFDSFFVLCYFSVNFFLFSTFFMRSLFLFVALSTVLFQEGWTLFFFDWGQC